jgi:hypothetical protein
MIEDLPPSLISLFLVLAPDFIQHHSFTEQLVSNLSLSKWISLLKQRMNKAIFVIVHDRNTKLLFFTHIQSRGGTPYIKVYGEARPERVYFSAKAGRGTV